MSFHMNVSKFRNVVAHENSRTNWYNGVRPNISGDSTVIASDGYCIALSWNTAAGGAVAFIPFGKIGKVPEPPLLHCHSGSMNEMAFSPCQPNIFVTCGDDSTVKVWHRHANGPTDNEATLSEHSKAVLTFSIHPFASEIIASGSYDKTLKIWDVSAKKSAYSLILMMQFKVLLGITLEIYLLLLERIKNFT